MIYGYEQLLVAVIVAITIADVRPLVAVTGPYLAPAPAVAVVVTRGKRRTDEEEIVAEEAVMQEKAVIPIEAAKSAKAVIPIEAPYGHAPASKPGAETAATEAPETATTKAAEAAAEMHSTATEPAVHSATTESATRHGWRWEGDCRSEQGCGDTTEDTAFHDSDPPPKEFMLVADRRCRG
ncbi:MAG: hypothetical protein ACREC4_04275 [Methylocella sp.]